MISLMEYFIKITLIINHMLYLASDGAECAAGWVHKFSGTEIARGVQFQFAGALVREGTKCKHLLSIGCVWLQL